MAPAQVPTGVSPGGCKETGGLFPGWVVGAVEQCGGDASGLKAVLGFWFLTHPIPSAVGKSLCFSGLLEGFQSAGRQLI